MEAASDSANQWAIDIDDIRRAAERLSDVAVMTPVVSSAEINSRCGAEIFFKAENLQRTGAFKFRGAYNSIGALSDAERSAGVITFSSGNHAQAIAKAAQLNGCHAVIVMPHDAPEGKVAATLAAGAELVRYDRYTEDRAAIAEALATEQGRVVIPPYDWPNVIAGQGTAALELFEQVPDLDALVVCLGGGGLLAGSAIAAHASSPGTSIFGVEPEAGDDHRRSRAAGERVSVPIPVTIADGQQTPSPGELTWPITSTLVTDFLSVTDEEIVRAMAVLFRDAKLVAEPSGASAFAAVLAGQLREQGFRRIGVTISGGNVDLATFAKLTENSADQ